MALLKCKTCGASLEIPSGTTVCECEYCGTKQTIDELEHAKNRAKKKSKRELEAERKAAQSKKMMWEMIISVTAIVLVFAIIFVCITQCNKEKGPATALRALAGYATSDTVTDYVQMDLSWTDNNGKRRTGSIVVQLRGDIAPITVENFKSLVDQGFYNGLTFHRIIQNFMIQGGCPKGDGTGNAGKTIKGEFSSNGVQNSLLHERGVLSMARGNSMDSASCQFFIVHQTSPHLDGDYAAFGYTVYGLDVVDAVAALRTDSYDAPLDTVLIDYMDFVNPQA